MSSTTIFTAARIFDGARTHEPGFVRIEGDRIQEVGTRSAGLRPSDGARVVDLPTGTLLPGLINSHAHLAVAKSELGPQLWSWSEGLLAIRAAKQGESELRAGVTSARDLGEKGDVAFIHKRAIESGLVNGPRLRVCGQLICITGGHGYHMGIEADGLEDTRVVVRRLLKSGADLIKVIASGGMNVAGTHPLFPWDVTPGAEAQQVEMSAEIMRIVVEEAGHVDKPVAAHAYGMAAIRNCIDAGVATIEHGVWLDEPGAEALAERGIALVPAISGNLRMAERAIPIQVRERAARALDAHKVTVQLAHRAGVRLGVGTDSQGDMAAELRLFVDVGISPLDALTAATRVGSEILGLSAQIGTLEAGKLADILGVEGNPLHAIDAIRDVRLVMKGGEMIVDPERPN